LKLGEQSPLKEQIEAQRGWIIANAMVNREADAYQVSDEQMNDFYKKNEARWQQAKIKAIFIAFTGGNVVSLDPNDLAAAAKQSVEAAHPANERSQPEAKKLADDIVKQLRAGADFGKLVDQYSDDSTSKQMGGEFPLIKATSPYPEDLKKAIFSMKNGDISDPVLQPAGFYIIRVDQKSVQPLDEVREPILQELRQSHRNDWLNDLNRRFVPVVQKPEFFLQPELYVQKATAPGATAKP
jgi:parvulin-like peptidyl-prolyl isomerase